MRTAIRGGGGRGGGTPCLVTQRHAWCHTLSHSVTQGCHTGSTVLGFRVSGVLYCPLFLRNFLSRVQKVAHEDALNYALNSNLQFCVEFHTSFLRSIPHFNSALNSRLTFASKIRRWRTRTARRGRTRRGSRMWSSRPTPAPRRCTHAHTISLPLFLFSSHPLTLSPSHPPTLSPFHPPSLLLDAAADR